MMDNNDSLVVVDVQSFYEQGFEHLTPDYITKLENTNKPIVYFFVGEELSNENKSDVIMFLLKNGLSEEKCSQIRFIEKDYGFYRSFMDNNISSESIIEIIKEMRENNFNDLRDIFDEGYESIGELGDLSKSINKQDIIKIDVLLNSGDTIYLPNFNDRVFNVFDKKKPIEMIGGGRWECLEEISIHLKSLGFTINVNEKLSFGAEPIDYTKRKKNKM